MSIAGYTGSKNLVRNRQKKFQTRDFKILVEMNRANGNTCLITRLFIQINSTSLCTYKSSIVYNFFGSTPVFFLRGVHCCFGIIIFAQKINDLHIQHGKNIEFLSYFFGDNLVVDHKKCPVYLIKPPFSFYYRLSSF